MILVTGATGFVGSALCSVLADAGRPYRPIARARLAGHIEIGEIGPSTDWTVPLDGVDVVVHLAARVHLLNDTQDDPLAAYRLTNVDATLNLARQAARRGVKRFIFMSSIKVNGESTSPTAPFKATDPPIPSDPYGRSKLEAEVALRHLANETGLELVIIRPPLVYGPGVKANFRTMLTWVCSGVPLPLAAIQNKRSFVSVHNLVDLILRCADHDQAPGQVFLVSDGDDLSTPQLLRALARSANRPARLFSLPVPWLRGAAALTGQQPRILRLVDWLQIDLSATQSTLGWTPPLTVEEAFARSSRQGW